MKIGTAIRIGRLARARANLLLFTDDLANAYWTKSTSNATAAPVVTADYATAPDGSLTADRVQITLPGDGEWSGVNRSAIATVAGVQYTISAWLKATDAGQVGKKVVVAWFDGAPGFPGVATHILTADWVRVSATATVATTSAQYFVGKHRSTGIGFTNAEASTDFLVWHARFEAGPIPSMGV